MSPFRYTIELSPPIDPYHLGAYYEEFKHLLKYTKSFSVSSHSTSAGLISGFYRSYNLARYLLERHPDVDILYHITCHDLNRINIQARLSTLKALGIRRILVITGEGYTKPAKCLKNRELFYRNSVELLREIKATGLGQWFELIAIAGYPSPNEAELECDRLVAKSIDGFVNAIYTQCLFSVSNLSTFFELLDRKLPSVKIVPSIALFDSMQSLNRSSRLTKVKPSENLLFYLQAIDEEDSVRFCRRYLEQICRKFAERLTKNEALEINICSFGLFDFASQLIESLEFTANK